MDLYALISILADIFWNIALVGTGITVILFIVTIVFKVDSMKRATTYFCAMFIIIWLLEVGCSAYLLINNSQTTAALLSLIYV